MQLLKSQPADGHTLALTTNAHAAWNPNVFSKRTCNPETDLQAVGPISVIPMALALNPKLGAVTQPGVPDAVVQRLNREIGAALADPALAAAFEGHGSVPYHASPAAFAQCIADDRALWSPLLQRIGVNAD